MAGTLSLSNFFSYVNQGQTISGSQGPITATSSTPLAVTTTGPSKYLEGTVATATAQTVYTAANDFPATFINFFYWADQASYLQIIGSATNVVIACAATQPFVLGNNQILAAANTTPISGSAPSVTAVGKVVIQNNSGTTMNFLFAIIL